MYTLPPIYGRNVKWRKTFNEMGGKISVGNFLGGNFPGGGIFKGGVWWVGILLGGIFLEPFLNGCFLFENKLFSLILPLL